MENDEKGVPITEGKVPSTPPKTQRKAGKVPPKPTKPVRRKTEDAN